MPAQRGKGKKRQPPRRTHRLGGCITCRRRHVKCDQARPHCQACSAAGIECEGFPSRIRWASVASTSEAHESISIPAKEKGAPVVPDLTARANVCSAPPEGTSIPPTGEVFARELGAATVDADLLEIEERTKNGNHGAEGISIGPFGVMSFDPPSASVDIPELDLQRMAAAATSAPHIEEFEVNTAQPMDRAPDLVGISPSSIDCNALAWTDLFYDPLNYMYSAFGDPMYDDPLNMLTHAAEGDLQDRGQSYGVIEHGFFAPELPPNALISPILSQSSQPPPYTPVEVGEDDLLANAGVLIKHFKDAVINQFAPVPLSSKSPWEILNCNAAVQTIADMTYLQKPDVRHAQKANLFGILACAAYHIMHVGSVETALPLGRCEKLFRVASVIGKENLQQSLKSETSGGSKAKYKDQLMALISMTALTSISGNHKDARCYLVDAERLLRLRGLAKTPVSRRCRLLHHVYTWLRIVGESTFVSHNYETYTRASSNTPDTRLTSIRQTASRRDEEDRSHCRHRMNTQLDDFLHVQQHETDSEPGSEEPKERDVGLRDIHLEDMRPWDDTMYMRIYGIPETWLSLLSQITRLANVIGVAGSSPAQADLATRYMIEKKITRLEGVICAFASKSDQSHRQISSDRGQSATGKHVLASHHILRAMDCALVIFFYRRIRNVNPWILQRHVADVIEALKAFEETVGESSLQGPGTPWPAFIAGCEAASKIDRDWLMGWMEKASRQSASEGFRGSQDVMQQVWARRDGRISARERDMQTKALKADPNYSWVDVLRTNDAWLMLY